MPCPRCGVSVVVEDHATSLECPRCDVRSAIANLATRVVTIELPRVAPPAPPRPPPVLAPVVTPRPELSSPGPEISGAKLAAAWATLGALLSAALGVVVFAASPVGGCVALGIALALIVKRRGILDEAIAEERRKPLGPGATD